MLTTLIQLLLVFSFISFYQYFKLIFTFYTHEKHTRNTKLNFPSKQDICLSERTNFTLQYILSEIFHVHMNVCAVLYIYKNAVLCIVLCFSFTISWRTFHFCLLSSTSIYFISEYHMHTTSSVHNEFQWKISKFPGFLIIKLYNQR